MRKVCHLWNTVKKQHLPKVRKLFACLFVIDDAIKHKIQLQDYKNQKIDAVIELPDGQWCAFEIKLGANQIDSAAANLLALKSPLSGFIFYIISQDKMIVNIGLLPSVIYHQSNNQNILYRASSDMGEALCVNWRN